MLAFGVERREFGSSVAIVAEAEDRKDEMAVEFSEMVVMLLRG